MIGKRGGIISYLNIQNKGRGTRDIGRIRTYNLQHGPVILEKKKTAKTTQPQGIIYCTVQHKLRTNIVISKHLGVK